MIVLHEADRLQPTCNTRHHAIIADRVGQKRHRLQARRALAVDGGAGNRHRQSGDQQRAACDVEAGCAFLHGAAHHHIFDLAPVEARALERVPDRVGTKC